MSPRRSVLASVAAGCCLAASVVVGGYAASGAMPFSDWPGGLFASEDTAEVALVPAPRAAAPVLTLPAATPERERESTRVIPLDDATPEPASEPAGDTPQRSATRLPKSVSRAPKTDDPEPDSKPTTAPAATAPQVPAATAASPAAEQGPTQPAARVTPPTTRRVKLGDVSTSFASASDSGSGQPELKVQMAVADETQTAQTRTVALSLKLSSADIQALTRNAATVGSSRIALETEVDVVDNTVVSAGQPACADGTCLRVQMKFAEDTRTNPADQPEVQLLEDGDAISNRVKVVVKIDPSDLGSRPAPAPAPTDPAAEPAPEAGAPSVLSLPMPPAADPDPATPDVPSTDSTTVALPDADPTPGTPPSSSVQVQAQLEVVDTPPAPAAPETPQQSATTGATPVTSPPAGDC